MSARVTFSLPTLNRGGAERVLVSLARKLARNSFDVSLVTLHGTNPMREGIPSEVRLVFLKSSRSSRCIPALAKTFQSHSPDLIVSTTHHMNVASTVAARLARIENIALRCPNTPSAERDLGWPTAVAARWAYRRARHVIAQTEEMKLDIGSRFGVNLVNVKVLQDPIDTELIHEKLSSAGTPYEPGTVNVVTAGRLSRQKGIDLLIRSFAEVVKRDPRLQLHTLGRDGREEASLRKLNNCPRIGAAHSGVKRRFEHGPMFFGSWVAFV